MSYVYLVQFSNTKNSIKIGFTKDYKTRLKHLSNIYGYIMHCYIIQHNNTQELERYLHRKFKSQRIRLSSKTTGYTEFFNIDNFKDIIEVLPKGCHTTLYSYDAFWFRKKNYPMYFKGNGLIKNHNKGYYNLLQ